MINVVFLLLILSALVGSSILSPYRRQTSCHPKSRSMDLWLRPSQGRSVVFVRQKVRRLVHRQSSRSLEAFEIIKLSASATTAICRIKPSSAKGFPKAILSEIVLENKKTSCITIEMFSAFGAQDTLWHFFHQSILPLQSDHKNVQLNSLRSFS